MASEEEWRQIAYQRWVGETGNNTMGTTWNNEGYQTYQARQAATEQFYRDASRSLETPSWTPAQTTSSFTPSAPQPRTTLGGTAPPVGTAPPRTYGGTSGGSGFLGRLEPFFDVLDVSDAEDFWDASDWLLEPLERVTPRWLVISICSLAAVFAAVAMFNDGAEVVASLLAGAACFFAPILGYIVLRLAVSTATLAVVLAVALALFGAALTTVGAGAYGIYLVAQAILA